MPKLSILFIDLQAHSLYLQTQQWNDVIKNSVKTGKYPAMPTLPGAT